MHFNKIFISVLLLAISSLQFIYADKSSSNYCPKKHFKKIDTDQNNTISQEEFHQFQQQKFDRLDSNNDGLISSKEWSSNRYKNKKCNKKQCNRKECNKKQCKHKKSAQ